MTKMRKPSISGSVHVIFLKEGDMFVAYSPTLDLTTCAPTFDEAKKNLSAAVGIFFDECLKHGTLDRALESLGWQKGTGHLPQWQPPVVVGEESLPLPLVN
jgi:hypothetical protein